MASSPANANHPRIPGRCDICDLKDGKNGMNFVQCSKCKLCVHRECYMVYPEDDVNEFLCFACAAVGRTYQAVETHMSSEFFEIEQKERPVECALCSVSHGIHAMYPLFDYHGLGGRQICVTKKAESKNGNSNEKVLVWGHALCALYLASVGFMYACFKDGDYIGMEEGEDDTDSRPPNPELKITSEFTRIYGDNAMPYFRYYLALPNGALDVWTKAILENKRELKCIECGLADDNKTLRIPLQCVANDPDEYFEYRNKHRERNNDVAPCTQALHVGCARWGDPSSTVRKVYYFPGHTNNDGSIMGNVDTVHCLYCKNHAENVDENHHKIVRRDKALLEKKKAAEKVRLEQIQQRTIRSTNTLQKAGSTSKGRFQHKASDLLPLPSFSTHPKRPMLALKGTKSASKNTNKRSQFSMPKASRAQGKCKSREQDRYKEFDPSAAAGQQTALSKRRRQEVNQIFDDLVSHHDETSQNPIPIMNGRKRYWKHEFSGLSNVDFDSIWIKARKRFQEHQNRKANLDNSKSSTSDGIELTHDSTSIDSHNPTLDIKERKMCIDSQKSVSRKKNKNSVLKHNLRIDDNSVMEVDYNASKSDEMERSEGNIITQKSCEKPEEKQNGVRPPDRWSKLFIGQLFEMGNESILDKFEKTI